ncbi:hypothetical protein RYX36_015871, partial [Vicia faba]
EDGELCHYAKRITRGDWKFELVKDALVLPGKTYEINVIGRPKKLLMKNLRTTAQIALLTETSLRSLPMPHNHKPAPITTINRPRRTMQPKLRYESRCRHSLPCRLSLTCRFPPITAMANFLRLLATTAATPPSTTEKEEG